MTYTERWTGNKQSRGGTAIDLIVIHDEEGDSDADNLGAYLQRLSVQASYNLIVDKWGNVCRGVADNEAPWAAGPIANKAGLHLCFTGRASFTRQQWIDRAPQMDAAAVIVADWSTKYGIPLVKVGPRELNAPAPGARGVCGHGDVAQAWRETSHTDPGPFAWDVLIDKARAHQGGATAKAQEDDDMSAWDTPVDNQNGAELPAGVMLGWIDKHTADLWAEQPNHVDFASIGEPEPETRISFTPVDAIYNADARGYESRQLLIKVLARLDAIEARLPKAGA